jgi:hypothetical protein
MTAVGFNSDPEEVVKASWSNFNMMVPLHLKCWQDHLSHKRCLERTTLGDELEYCMYTESSESTTIPPKVMRIVYLKVIRTPKFGFTGLVTWIIHTTVKTAGRQTMNCKQS